MGKASPSPIVDQARLLLHLFTEAATSDSVHHADDLLTFFHNLHDNYEVLRSTSPRFSGETFVILEETIYQLKANPDATLKSAGLREFITLVLDDIASGRVEVRRKQPATSRRFS